MSGGTKSRSQFSEVLPNLNEWPIIRLTREREAFLLAVQETALQKLREKLNGDLNSELERTLFHESLRLQQQPWSTDAEDDPEFWNHVKDELLNVSQAPNGNQQQQQEQLLNEVITRYTGEIAGSFNIRTYRLAQRILGIAFYPLLNAPLYLNFLERKLSSAVKRRIHFSGEVENLRELTKSCTVILVPTHFTNLDSVVVGWAIRTLGLPAFLYGAGLNLFGIRIFSFFMNRLGSFKIDRRKKNPVYLETLKAYSTQAIHRGCHSFFFPYSDRSLSGSINPDLRLGMLSTAIEAQFLNIQKAEKENTVAKKIIIAPMVLNYHFVLEAPFLVDEYLQSTGKENYLSGENDQFSTSFELTRVIMKMFSKDSEFLLSFGDCMDVFGNKVDREGRSLDASGRELNIRDYFLLHGELRHDPQRHFEYTRMLGRHIAESYLRGNTVFSSHIAAFSVFEILRNRNPRMDIYDLVRLQEQERLVPYIEVRTYAKQLMESLRIKKEKGELMLDTFLENELGWDVDRILKHGIKNAGIYHARKTLLVDKHGNVTTEDMKLLFYYHNRINHYGLEKQT